MHIPSRQRRKWCGLLSHTDAGIARVVAALKSKEMWQDTLFMFLSDNGGDINRSDFFLSLSRSSPR